MKRPRLVWTEDLHKCFEDAVEKLGLAKATPKAILEVPSLTQFCPNFRTGNERRGVNERERCQSFTEVQRSTESEIQAEQKEERLDREARRILTYRQKPY